MDAGYDALEEAASSYTKTRERDDESRSHRGHRERESDRDRDRERERRHREREERGGSDRRGGGGDDNYRPDRESGRDRHRERDEYRERSDRERERYDRERGGSERDRDRERERPRRRRREDDEFDLAAEPMNGSNGSGHRDRRPRHEDPYAQPMRGYGSPPRRSRRSDDDDWRGGRDRERSRSRERRRRGGRDNRSPTPPGTVPLEERHVVNSHWDIRPSQFEGIGAMEAKMTGMFTYGPGRVPPPASLGVPNQLMAGSFPPANPTRQTKRLYVGGINDRMSEQDIQGFFDKLMIEHKLAVDMPGNPTTTCQINNEKNFAFIEFRTPEEATAALQFDGVMYDGHPLRVRRPKDYSGVDPLASQFGGSSNPQGGQMIDSPNKLFIGGLPTYLNDEQVIELLKAFGELKSFNLVKETGNVSKGFAFCEYMDSNVTDMAIQGLHNFSLGDRTLVVQRAAVGRNQNNQNSQNNNHNHALPGSAAYLQQAVPNILSSANQSDAPATRVMLLLNMVTPEELYSDEDYTEILEDINDECSKYGQVEGVRIPRPQPKNKKWSPGDSAAVSAEKNRKLDEENGVGRVYVMYQNIEDTKKAMNAIGGRQFGGRTILVANVPEEEFLGPAPPPPPPPEGEEPPTESTETENANSPPPPPPPPPAEEDLDAAAADAVKDIMSGIL
ncbi:uncharacterized protein L201_005940 [Kwoniella dendrophila CBS 6074]|uniref:RRM domain-containing protein n=1 Tax=Kwoniella dendrophila CBS 6074 TaxID=1295534 RepID=A0AAX4JZU2_9TREE